MPNLEPYLLWNDVELVNALRTLTYLRIGLGGSGWEVSVANPLVVPEGEGYSDFYSDFYGSDPYVVANLSCYCALADTGPYARPSYDPAPWYDPARPESADFLGMWPEIVLLNPAKRTVRARSGGGGSVGALVPGPRVVQVSGVMYAGSKAGMDWGELWLKQMLAGTEGCGGDSLTLLPTCPPDEVIDPSTYLRELRRVALIDGPTFGDAGVHRDVAQTVAFQLAAGDPYVRRTETLMGPTGLTGAVLSTVLRAPKVVGDAAAVLTVTGPVAGLAISGLTIDLDGSETLVVDSSDQTVTLNGASGGLNALSFSGLLPWITAATGTVTPIVVQPSGAGGSVRIDAVYREL